MCAYRRRSIPDKKEDNFDPVSSYGVTSAEAKNMNTVPGALDSDMEDVVFTEEDEKVS